MLFGSLSVWQAGRASRSVAWRALSVASSVGVALAVLWTATLGMATLALLAIPWVMDPAVGLTPIQLALAKSGGSVGGGDGLVTLGMVVSLLLLTGWLSQRIDSEAGIWRTAALPLCQ